MSSLAARRSARNATLQEKLRQMALPLHPLVQINTGLAHSAFPTSLLQFWLLTDDQLEALASFYHQRTPQRLTRHYPCPISWPREGLTLEDKRRKMGKFIGLRGCDTPPAPPSPAAASASAACDGCCATWETVDMASPSFCIDCSRRRVDAILAGDDGDEDKATGWDSDSGCPVVSILSPSASRPQRRSRPASPMRSRKRRALSPSSSGAAAPRFLTIEDVIEDARRARLAAQDGEEAQRNKAGHF